MQKGLLARKYYSEGANCSQAVALAFKNELNLTEEQVKKYVIAFGGGFGRQRLVCGAVSGMTFVLGALLSDGQDKLSIYKIEQQACAIIKEKLGSLVCAELLEAKMGENAKKYSCAEICEIVASVTQDILTEYSK